MCFDSSTSFPNYGVFEMRGPSAICSGFHGCSGRPRREAVRVQAKDFDGLQFDLCVCASSFPVLDRQRSRVEFSGQKQGDGHDFIGRLAKGSGEKTAVVRRNNPERSITALDACANPDDHVRRSFPVKSQR